MSRPSLRTGMLPSTPITATTPTRTPTITPITATKVTIMGMIIMITSIAIIPTMTTIMPTTTTIMDMGPAEPDAALLPLMLWLSPAFPVGSFAYSHGLEWAVEAGDISTRARSAAGWSIRGPSAPARRRDLFAAAFRAAEVGEWPALIEVNDLAVALAVSAERRLETTAQGSAFVAAARAAWDCPPLRELSRKTASPIRPRSPPPPPAMVCRSN